MVDDVEGIVNHIHCENGQIVSIPSQMDFDINLKNDQTCMKNFTQTIDCHIFSEN